MAGVSCVDAESLGRLRRRKEPTMKGVPNLPDREAGLICRAARRIIRKRGEFVGDFLVLQSWPS